MDKPTIDRSIEEALGKQKIGDLRKETKENLGAHKDEIVDAISVVEGHAKSNKLLNILQVGEIAANFSRDNEVREEAKRAEQGRKDVKKHSVGARNSRSRIEGGIKDIKDMMGGDTPRATQTEQLADSFSAVAMGSVGGKNKDQINANAIMKSFGEVMGSKNLEDLGTELESKDRDVLNEFTRSMDKISKIAMEGKFGDLDDKVRGRAEEAAKEAGFGGIDFSSRVTSMQAMQQEGPGSSKATREAFKNFRDMADERRITKPVAKGGFTSGVDTESWPQKQYEVLTEILDILERWNKSAFGDDNGGPGMDPGRNLGKNKNKDNTAKDNKKDSNKKSNQNKGQAKPSNARNGFINQKDAGPNAVKSQNGRFFPANSTQGQAIVNASAPKGSIANRIFRGVNAIKGGVSSGVNAVQGVAQKGLNFMSGNSKFATGLKWGGGLASVGLSVADETMEYLGERDQALKDNQLEKTDADYLSDDALNRELDEEKLDAVGSVFGGLGGALAGAGKGALIGTALGGPVGTIVGGFIGGGLGYMAGSKAGGAVLKSLAFDSDAMNAAQDSGLYNKNWIGDSQVDMDMVKNAPTEQLQAIIQDEDISEDIENRLRDEIDKRTRDFGTDYDTTAPMLQVAESAKAVNLETGNAIENTQTALEEAQDAKEILISTNTVTNNKVEKTTQEIMPVISPGMTTTSNDSLLIKANVIPWLAT